VPCVQLCPRETREGWHLLTVETEVNGDSKSTIERGPSLVGSLGSSCRYKRLFILPWLLWSAQEKYFFPYRTLFQPGQAVVQGRLSLNVCLRLRQCEWSICRFVETTLIKAYFIYAFQIYIMRSLMIFCFALGILKIGLKITT
jgi:hypothetical protein